MDLQLTGRRAVVLGGTDGIGRATALLLAAEGAAVMVQGRNDPAGTELVELIRSTGGTASFATADLYDYAQIDAVLARCESEFGGMEIVVASGGAFEPAPASFLDLEPDQLPLVIRSRLQHRMNAIHASALRMRQHGYGKIVTLTTEAGRTPTPLETVIGASSAALNFLVRSVARELAREGIRLNSVSVSLTTQTPSHTRHLERLSNNESRGLAGVFSKLEARAAFGLCSPNDIAGAVAFLASPASDKMTGATLSINGGTSFPSYA